MCGALTTVVISEGVTTLGEDLFYGKTNLKELTIPSTVTSIGGYALYGCTSLEVIHVSNDGDIDALKQMLYESGFDVESVTFDHVKEPVYVYYKVAFDAQGGVAKWTETEVRDGKPIGELPTAERDGYEFLGWFTSAVGGTQVMSATVVTKDVTFYAHWKYHDYAVRFDANGGFGEMANQPFTVNTPGELSANRFLRKDCRFAGWALSPEGGSRVRRRGRGREPLAGTGCGRRPLCGLGGRAVGRGGLPECAGPGVRFRG